MSDFDAIAQNKESMTPERIRVIEKAFIKYSTKMLKFEWKRVKRGEINFVVSKIAFAAIVVSGLIYVALMGWREGSASKLPVHPGFSTSPCLVR